MADQELVNKLQTIAEEGIGTGEDKVQLTVKEAADFTIKVIEAASRTARPLISPQQALAIKLALTI